MKMKNAWFATLLSVFVFYSCSTEDENLSGTGVKPTAVQFTSTISGQGLTTRASGSSWAASDEIGVFMKKAGQGLSGGSIVDGADNKSYSTDSGDGSFSATTSSEEIYLPENGSKVDFIAYYPLSRNINNFIYSVDVTNQASQESIDLLYSNNATNVSLSNQTYALSFSHQLAKVALNIEAGSDLSSLDGLKIGIDGLKTQADFNLSDGSLTVNNASVGNVALKMTGSGKSMRGEAIIIPDEGGSGRTIIFTLPSVGTYKWTIPTAVKYEKGKRYTYNITLTKNGSVVKPDYPWIETPTIESIENTMYVTHMLPDRDGQRNYSMLYDTKYKLAYWVAYPLHKFHIVTGKRTNAWQYDPVIPNQYQPNLKSSYKETYLDRGHQLPSGDRTYSEAANRTTFYYSNMTAQYNTLNQQSWARLEGQIRTWTEKCDTMYVVTGAMLTTKSDKNIEYATDASGAKIGKPKYYYKALAQRYGNTYYTIAYKMDNVNTPNNEDFNQHRLTVKELEEETGFEFFPGVASVDKSKIVENQWN